MRRKLTFLRLPALALLLALLGIGAYLRFCGNNPWPRNIDADTTQFSSLALSFKTLDPAVSYYEHEMNILDSVVEMPYEYHYLKRPYQLVPMLMEDMPQVEYFSAEGQPLPNDAPAESIAKVQYTMRLKKGVMYQPHPCFAKDEHGNPAYFGKELKLPGKWRRPAEGCALYWTNRITTAFQEKDPAKRERLLDQVRWDAAGELTPAASPLSAAAAFTYAIRLAISIRRTARVTDAGNEVFNRLIAAPAPKSVLKE